MEERWGSLMRYEKGKGRPARDHGRAAAKGSEMVGMSAGLTRKDHFHKKQCRRLELAIPTRNLIRYRGRIVFQ